MKQIIVTIHEFRHSLYYFFNFTVGLNAFQIKWRVLSFQENKQEVWILLKTKGLHKT